MKILNILTPRRILGNLGEAAACKFLKENGYKILEKNYEGEGAEIDIIAKNKECLIFAEVKTRDVNKIKQKEPRPASAVTRDKQQKIINAAWEYIQHCGKGGRLIRFDIIEVYTEEKNGNNNLIEIKHLKNAFNFNSAFGRRY